MLEPVEYTSQELQILPKYSLVLSYDIEKDENGDWTFTDKYCIFLGEVSSFYDDIASCRIIYLGQTDVKKSRRTTYVYKIEPLVEMALRETYGDLIRETEAKLEASVQTK